MTTVSKKKLRITIFLILCSFVAVHLFFRLLPGVFETWNAQIVDQLFAFRSSSEKLRPPYDNTVVHVDLNNTSIRRLKNLYLNRSHYAKVLRNLDAMDVSVQMYDFIFAARLNEENDQALVRATADAGNVYFGTALELWERGEKGRKNTRSIEGTGYLDQTKWHVNVEGDAGDFYTGRNPLLTYSDLASASRGLGSLSVKFDRDGVLRRVPLLVRYGEGFYPILPFRVICDYLGVPPEKIFIRPGKFIRLRGAQKPGEEEPHDIVIPIDGKGNMIVNYIGNWERMDHYNFADILKALDDRDEMEMWRKEMKGKIVVVSDVSTGSTDVGPVPTDANFPLSGAHANVIHNILTESFVRELSGLEMLMAEVLLMIMVVVLSIRYPSIHFSVGTLSVGVSYIVIVGISFFYGRVVFHIIRPLLMVGFAMVAILVHRYVNEEREKMESLRQRDFIRDTFGRYLSREVVQELLGSPEGLKMSGEIREVTFLVSDLRGFTALTEKLSPHELINIINRYFGRMVEIIARYRGTVNEFLGDGILSFFGAPFQATDDPERAVACAVEMQNGLGEFNEEQRGLNLPELAMGIGLNTGDVVVGNIGSEKRASYGAVGSPINTAFRIETFTVGGQILISPDTFERVQSVVRLKGTMEAQFKGLAQPVTLYDVVGMEGEFQISLRQKTADSLSKLETPLPINCFPLEGKTISEDSIPGLIIYFGGSSAQVSLEQEVGLYSNLKILLAAQEDSAISEIYAKVVSLDQSDSMSSFTHVRLEFTYFPEDVKKFIIKKCERKGASGVNNENGSMFCLSRKSP